MIFDDEQDILDVCNMFLSKAGYNVATRATCKDVVEDVKLVKPDLIFMDNLIPETGGIVATQLLKSEVELQKIPVVYFTASNNIHTLAHQAGADAYLAKPFDMKAMLRVAEEYLTKNLA